MGNIHSQEIEKDSIYSFYESFLKIILEECEINTINSYEQIQNEVSYIKISNWVLLKHPNDNLSLELTQREQNLNNCKHKLGFLYEGEKARLARRFMLCSSNITGQDKNMASLNNNTNNNNDNVLNSSILSMYYPTQENTNQNMVYPGSCSSLIEDLNKSSVIQDSLEMEQEPNVKSIISNSRLDLFHNSNSIECDSHCNDSPSSMLNDYRNKYNIHTNQGASIIYKQMSNILPVYGDIVNHKSFLDPEALDYFIPFILDESLISLLSVCKHWYTSIYSYLQKRVSPLIEALKETYRPYLEFHSFTFSMQPLYVCNDSVIRIDLLVYCKVLPKSTFQCTEFGYTYNYTSPANNCSHSASKYNNKVEYSNEIDKENDLGDDVDTSSPNHKTNQNKIYHCHYRYMTLKKNTKRTIWIHRDICRFHGDELMVASLANIPTLNVDDYLEIPINISNAIGVVDINSITWLNARLLTENECQLGQICEIEDSNELWSSLDVFQSKTNEYLENYDRFSPQWKNIKTEFRGIDITYSRSEYIANCLGKVNNSEKWLGMNFFVKSAQQFIICPLTRVGLQHDRFSAQEVRQGDSIVLYISQGGSIDQ